MGSPGLCTKRLMRPPPPLPSALSIRSAPIASVCPLPPPNRFLTARICPQPLSNRQPPLLSRAWDPFRVPLLQGQPRGNPLTQAAGISRVWPYTLVSSLGPAPSFGSLVRDQPHSQGHSREISTNPPGKGLIGATLWDLRR